jgi:glycosyltransferase involved in cell wall biosynthesis
MGLIAKTGRTLVREGPASTFWRAAKYLGSRRGAIDRVPLSSVYPEDVLAADWARGADQVPNRTSSRGGGRRIAWLISPPSRTSGGHHNAFRFMEFAEKAGYRVSVFFYAPQRYPKHTVAALKHMMASTVAFPRLAADFEMYNPAAGLSGEFDAIVASDWQTSYAVARHAGSAKKFYFVQDFEPSFYPVGSDYVLAEDSYRLGLHGLTAGPWLAKKLREDYGMSADHFDFAVNLDVYRRTETGRRSEVLFYVRPETPRRGTELGLLALQELHRLQPEITINLVGADMSHRRVPFPHVDHGSVDLPELNDIYNRCAAGLVLSLTNISLLPLEVMASGVVPIVNDAENTRGLIHGDEVEYVSTKPSEMAERMIDVVDAPDQVGRSARIADAMKDASWQDAGATFVGNLRDAMSG